MKANPFNTRPEEILKRIQTVIPEYDSGCLLFNMKCVMKDIEAKRLPMPDDLDELLDMLLNEYAANVSSFVNATARG